MLVKNKAYNSQEIEQSLKNSENLGKILEIKEFFLQQTSDFILSRFKMYVQNSTAQKRT